MNNFGKLWKSHRTVNRLTYRAVSEKLGLSIGYLSDIEQGRKPPPDLEVVRKYEDLVGIVDHSLVTLASKIKTKLNDVDAIKARTKLNELLLKANELSDDQIDTLIDIIDEGIE